MLALFVPQVAAAQAVHAPNDEPKTLSAGQGSGTGQPATDGGGDIVVTAIHESLQAAQAVKQGSDQIVDSIVAEDIGKLPDVTAAESLARVTGVQVTRAEGEASGVRIRGLPDITTTYNGREIFTGEGRQVALQDFPAPSISRIDVYKSGSADLLEAGIAGLIDVRSRKPFDFRGDRFAGGVSGIHWRQSQKLAVDGNLLVSKRWTTGVGDIGILVEGSYTNNDFLDSSRNVSQSILSRTGVSGAIRYPSFVNIDYVTGDRWRPSASAALQWRPSSRLEFYVDGLYQGYHAQNESRNLNIGTGQAALLSNIEYFEATNIVRSVTASGGALPTGTQNATDADTDTYQAGGGFIWKPGLLKVKGDAAFTDSTYTQRALAFNYSLTSPPMRTFDFDNSDGVGGGTVVLSDFDLLNSKLYRLTSLSESLVRNHGRDFQARLDIEYPVGIFGIATLQAGIRYNDRNTTTYNGSRTGIAPPAQLFTVLPLDYTSATPGFAGDDLPNVRTWLTPTRDSLLAQADALRALTGLPRGPLTFGDPIYAGYEKGFAAYAQARYEIDLGVRIDGLIGIRAVRTEDRINGLTRASTSTGTTLTPIQRKNAYDDFLPNVSARLKFTRDLQLRVAFTQTRTRPGFGSLNPSLTIGLPSSSCGADPADTSNPDCFRSASGGNPDLKPVRSDNYDASLEYYFSRSGSLTVGVFHRDVVGFINNTTTQVVDPDLGRLTINRPENGGRGKISGAEVGFRTFLTASALPVWARNFGVLANYTYLDHKSELAPALAVTLPGFQPLSGVSRHLVNLSAFYENRFFSTRVSYNYRSRFVVGYSQVADPGLNNALGPALPLIEDGRGSLDLSSSMTPVENFTLSFNVTNLLGQSASNSRAFNAQGQRYPFQTRFLETVYRLSARFSF